MAPNTAPNGLGASDDALAPLAPPKPRRATTRAIGKRQAPRVGQSAHGASDGAASLDAPAEAGAGAAPETSPDGESTPAPRRRTTRARAAGATAAGATAAADTAIQIGTSASPTTTPATDALENTTSAETGAVRATRRRRATAPDTQRAETDATPETAGAPAAPTSGASANVSATQAQQIDQMEQAQPMEQLATHTPAQPRRRFDHRPRGAYHQTITLGESATTATPAQEQGAVAHATDATSIEPAAEAPNAGAHANSAHTSARQSARRAQPAAQNAQPGQPTAQRANGQPPAGRGSVPYSPGARTSARPNTANPGGHPGQNGQNAPTRGGNGQGAPNYPPQAYPQGYGQGYPQQGYPQGYPPDYGQGYPPAYAPGYGPGYAPGYPPTYPPNQGYGATPGYPTSAPTGQRGRPGPQGQSPYGAPPGYQPYAPRDPRDPYGAQRNAPEYPAQAPQQPNRPTRGRTGYGAYPEQTRDPRDQRGAPIRPAPYGPNGERGATPGRAGQPPRVIRPGRDQRDGRDGREAVGSLYTNTPAPSGQDGRYGYAPAPTARQAAPATYTRTVEVSGIVWQNANHGNSPAELLDARTLQPIARVNQEDMRRLDLRPGDAIQGRAEERGGRRYVVALDSANGDEPERLRTRPAFDQLTALFPDRRIRLEHGPRPISSRVIDLFAPLGFGSRALIVAPPKTGKTTFIREAAESVLQGYPDAVVMAVLVGERPEEVTDLRLRLEPNGGHVYAASFDESSDRHAWLVQVAVERAKRVAESGRDAFMVLDSLTRLARAENLATRGNGRTLSGGIDAQALDTGRRAFGAARNLEEGGSITILATCLVDTGSRQDDVVYEEFKGTGNMEIHLSRELAQRRLFPAVDAVKSGTRREEMLLTPEELRGATALRRRMAGLPTTEATQQLLTVMERSPSNAALLQALEQSK